MRIPENFLFLGYFVKGVPIRKTLNFLRASQHYDRKSMEKFQLEKLRRLIHFAISNNLYYKELLADQRIKADDIQNLGDLKFLPLLTKEIIRREFPEKLLSSGISQRRFVHHETGGSTGTPLKFAYDKESIKWATAALYRTLEWYGVQVGEKIAYLVGSGSESLTDKLRFYFGDKVVLNAFNVDADNLKNYFSFITRNKIRILYGYPSALYIFSLYVIESGLKPWWPMIILSTGETLRDEYKQVIEEAFDCKVFDQYGCREINMIAAESPENGLLRIIDEHVIVEIVKNDSLLLPGTEGNIVVTDLDNYAMPFLRYDTGDLGVGVQVDSPCNFMNHVKGRTFDMLKDTQGNKVAPNIINSMMWGRFDSLEPYKMLGIKQYQVIQHSLKLLELNIITENEPTEIAETLLKEHISEKLGQDLEIMINWVDEIAATKAGKRLFIISKLHS